MRIFESNAALQEIIQCILFVLSSSIDYLITAVGDFFDLIDQLLVNLHETRLYLSHFSEK